LIMLLNFILLSDFYSLLFFFFFFSSRRRHTRLQGDWSSDVCSSDLTAGSRRSIDASRGHGNHGSATMPLSATASTSSSSALSDATTPASSDSQAGSGPSRLIASSRSRRSSDRKSVV